MKNTIKTFSLLLFLALIFSACDNNDIIILNSEANTTVSLSDNTLILTEGNADNQVLTVSWSNPDFGFNAAPSYQILMDVEGGGFFDPQIISVGIDLQKDFTAKELNDKLLALGVEPFESANIDIMVVVHLSDFQEISSEKVVLNVTPYSSTLDLSSTWGVVGSAANNWGATPDLPFFITSQAGVLVAYVTLIDGEIKFRENNSWTLNYGDTGNDGSLEVNGDNIAVVAGTYKILLNLNDLTYTIENYSWGIVGSAYNNWGATPDANLTYDSFSDQWRTIVTLVDGEMKFRQNNDWAVNYGSNDGVSIELNGGNISVTAGIYIVTVNFNELTYTLEEIDYVWGLVGGAYNNWGATPDAQFTRDWSTSDETWILKDVTLIDGEWKIRANNDWGINYGSNDGINLVLNGGNITATAGTYTIKLNFGDPDNPTYSIE